MRDGDIQFGDLRRTTPIADDYGFSRGVPIDRYYIERFLLQHAHAIHGKVAEIRDDGYTRAFGAERVTRAEVIDIARDNPRATICADLQDAPQIGSETFDCVICTQTLQYAYDLPRAIATLHRILKPGGVLLATLPGITQIGAGEATPLWQFTDRSAGRLFADVFGADAVEVQAHGNVLAAVAFLHGLAVHELREAELDSLDPGYQLLITVKATRAPVPEPRVHARGATAAAPAPRRSQIWAIGTVRNEADLVAINISHHVSQGIDRFLLVDDGSTDGTADVLVSLSRVAPVEWRRNTQAFEQQRLLTALAQEAYIRGADWVVPIDADEFWYAPASTLRDVLERSTAGALRVGLVTFIQRRDQHVTTPDCLLTMTRRPAEAIGSVDEIEHLVTSGAIAWVEHRYAPKWISRTGPSLQIGWGDHTLFGAAQPAEDTDAIVCLHAPLRSRAILEQKVDLARPVEQVREYVQRAWHIKRWRQIAASSDLAAEWAANSYADEALDVPGGRRPLVGDTRLRDLVAPWIAVAKTGAPLMARQPATTEALDDDSAIVRRMAIIGAVTTALDASRSEAESWRREVDRHGAMLRAAEQEQFALRRALEESRLRLTARKQHEAASAAALDRAERDLKQATRDRHELMRRLSETRNALAASDALVRALYASWSWRLAAPLRRALDAIYYVRNLGRRLTSPPAPPESIGGGYTPRTAPSSAPGFLVVTDALPTPDLDSGSFRLFHILELLVEVGYDVTLICDSEERTSAHEDAVRRLGVRLYFGRIEAERHLEAEGKRYAYAMLSRPDAALRYASVVRATAIHATVAYDTVDLHALRMARAADVTGDPEKRTLGDHYARVERFNAAAADMVIAITDVERSILLRQDPSLHVRVLPNIHPMHPAGPPWRERRGLMFIGGFWHHANEDAVQFFVRDILPFIATKLPEITFTIVGSNMPASIAALASAHVTPVGYVADPAPYFQGSRVFVAPLRFGAGMKGKIGQSLSFGLPVVTTSIGAEGMGFVDGETALIADPPEAFADAVVRLYTDEHLWHRLSDESMSHVRANFSEAAVRSALKTIFPVPAVDRMEATA